MKLKRKKNDRQTMPEPEREARNYNSLIRAHGCASVVIIAFNAFRHKIRIMRIAK